MKINKTRKGTGPAPVILAGGSGAVADRISKLKELQRSVLACLLWEDVAYENGDSIAQRIATLVPLVAPDKVAALAIAARTEGKLRHVPLLLAREMARHATHKALVADVLATVIQRADELSEFLSIYFKNDKNQPISAQVKKGLARAFVKFDEYALAKYSGKGNDFSLRDVLFLCHAKPQTKAQAAVWKRLINDELKTPDTWETALSASNGENKKEVWERLLSEEKLGALALIRNLRNFEQTGVDRNLVKKALKTCKTERILPFRFITAAKHAPRYQSELEETILRTVEGKKILKGKTVVIIDVSGSMNSALSGKSEMTRMECGASLAILLREQCEDVVFYATAGNDSTRIHRTELVRPHHGFALRDEIVNQASRLGGGGIFLKQVMDYVQDAEKGADRVIIFSDEQDTSKIDPSTANAWGKKNYIINISVEKGGIAYGKFDHINGFSEAVIDYIAAGEQIENNDDFAQALQLLRQ